MADLSKIVEELSSLKLTEAAELAKLLEKEWGVSAMAPSVAAASPVADSNDSAEKSEFDLVLSEVGSNKIAVIKEVKAITGLGLKEAKEIVDGAPKSIKSGVSKADADNFKKKLEEAGAKIELK